MARFSRVAGLPLNPLFGCSAAAAAVNAPITPKKKRQKRRLTFSFFLSLQGGKMGSKPEIFILYAAGGMFGRTIPVWSPCRPPQPACCVCLSVCYSVLGERSAIAAPLPSAALKRLLPSNPCAFSEKLFPTLVPPSRGFLRRDRHYDWRHCCCRIYLRVCSSYLPLTL